MTRLDLSQNGLLSRSHREEGAVGKGWEALCSALQEATCPLKQLSLGGQALSHTAVTALVESLRLNRRLESLDLKATELAPRSVSRLCLWGMDHDSLQKLDLRLNSITANTKQFLRDRNAQVSLASGEEKAQSEAASEFTSKEAEKVIYTGPFEPNEETAAAMVPAWKHWGQRPWEGAYAAMY